MTRRKTRNAKLKTRNNQGIVFVLSSPSGGGKTTVRKALLKADRSLVYSVSVTSRPRRAAERSGRDYHFVTREAFLNMARHARFLEFAKVHDAYYGTPHPPIQAALRRGQSCVLDVDIQGFESIKKKYPDSVSIFILPPSLTVLAQRLRKRGTDSELVIKKRLKNARNEIKYLAHYDYIVINASIAKTVQALKTIIAAERIKKEGQVLSHGYISSGKVCR